MEKNPLLYCNYQELNVLNCFLLVAVGKGGWGTFMGCKVPALPINELAIAFSPHSPEKEGMKTFGKQEAPVL